MARSWDIQPSRKRSAPVSEPTRIQRAAPARPQSTRVATSRPAPTRREAVRSTPRPESRTPLRRKRQLARRRLFYIVLMGLAILFALVEVILWQSFLRVTSVEVSGPSAEHIKEFVIKDLSGTRYLVLPRSSIFFLPEASLREHILEEFPNVEAVSISAAGLTTISITTVERASIFWWCGVSLATPSGSCYDTDSTGLIFAPVAPEISMASSSMLRVYVPLASSTVSTSEPTGHAIQQSAKIPGILEFVKEMRSLGANITAIDIHGDEADLYTAGGTRITYVLGREAQAAALASSAAASLNLNDGSLLYVDLRFDSKVFFKKK